MIATTKWLTAGVLALATAGAATAGGPNPAGYTPKPFPQYPGPYNPGPFPPGPFPLPPRPDTDYVVLVKALPFGGWHRYARFETAHAARRAAWRLESLGYRVRVEPVFGGPVRW
ncbi:MAG: hypothetical protein K2X82_10890 [Gemmataceae bacterium]|nr:hypothetical protein [Gemmataceae bacterium]